MNFKSLLEYINKLSTKKNISNLIVVFLLGVLLLIAGNFFKGTSTSASTSETKPQVSANTGDVELSQYESQLESELKTMLSSIKGVGKVDVMIHFSSGDELVPAVNSNDGSSTTKETDKEGGNRVVTQDNNSGTVVMTTEGNDSKPVVVKTLTPAISGAVIVAEGADDDTVRSDIKKAVSGLFGIPNYQVNVFPMNK